MIWEKIYFVNGISVYNLWTNIFLIEKEDLRIQFVNKYIFLKKFSVYHFAGENPLMKILHVKKKKNLLRIGIFGKKSIDLLYNLAWPKILQFNNLCVLRP